MELLIVADSTNRDTAIYPSGNSYVVHLNSPLRNVSRVDLVSARVPNTVYNLNTTSNVFTTGTSNVSLNAGFYSATGLASAVTSAGIINMAYLQNEGHFIFSNSGTFNLQITSQEFATMSGLDNNFLYTSSLATASDPGFNYIIRSKNVINLSMNEFVYLDVDELKTPNHVATGSIFSNTGTISGANTGRSFAPIVMDVGSACIKNFHESKDYKISVHYPEPIGMLSRLTIRWYDKNGSLLNFRGLETNAFIIRAYIEDDMRRLPPPPPLQDVELKRIVEAMSMVPEKPPEKKRKIPWVLITLVLLLGLFTYKTFFNQSPHTLSGSALSSHSSQPR
jgi:hypothetical protein